MISGKTSQLPHLRDQMYNGAFVYDPQTGQYGFQEGSEYDSEEKLMDDLINEVEGEDHAPKGDGEENVGYGSDHPPCDFRQQPLTLL